MTLLKNVADSPRGVHTLTGLVLIEAGEAREVELSPAERSGLASWFVVVKPEKASAPAPANPDGDGGAQGSGDAPPPPNYASLVAAHRGRGSWSVMDGDTEVVQGLDKDLAAAFNALDAEGKAAFVAERKPAGE